MRRISSLNKVARIVEAIVFDNAMQFKEYMKEHPNSDRSKHKVKDDQDGGNTQKMKKKRFEEPKQDDTQKMKKKRFEDPKEEKNPEDTQKMRTKKFEAPKKETPSFNVIQPTRKPTKKIPKTVNRFRKINVVRDRGEFMNDSKFETMVKRIASEIISYNLKIASMNKNKALKMDKVLYVGLDEDTDLRCIFRDNSDFAYGSYTSEGAAKRDLPKLAKKLNMKIAK